MEPQRGQMGGESVMPHYRADRAHRPGNRGEIAMGHEWGTTGRYGALQGATIRDSYFPKYLIYIDFEK